MAIRRREIITTDEIRRVIELRAQGYTRKQIVETMPIALARLKYIISLLPKSKTMDSTPHWYSSDRRTFTDTMPNPFPKWWCDKHGYDHNFYRPKWKR